MAETTHKAKLVGFDNFVRSNPKSDRFDVLRFHHVEFISGDAITTAARFSAALGMPFIARSNQMSGNQHYASHVIRSGSACIAFTSPYNSGAAPPPTDGEWDPSKCPNPTVTGEKMREQFGEHGLFVGAVCIQVADAAIAHKQAVAGGATSRAAPRSAPGIDYTVAEVTMYNGSDAVLRFISGSALDDDSMPFLPGYVAAGKPDAPTFGIQRMDHIVGNVPDLLSNVDHMIAATGFHEFAEFTAEDVGTVDSGLNSMVLASNNEAVLLPMNEPTTGGKRKSQILTYLEQNRGPGVQHIALKTDDIFATVAKMREAAGGFELMERPREQVTRTRPHPCMQSSVAPGSTDGSATWAVFRQPRRQARPGYAEQGGDREVPKPRHPRRRRRPRRAAADLHQAGAPAPERELTRPSHAPCCCEGGRSRHLLLRDHPAGGLHGRRGGEQAR